MRSRTERAVAISLLIFVTACGDNSTGPQTTTPAVSAQDALASLASGLSGSTTVIGGAPFGTASIASVAASQVGQATVIIDGKSVQTFAFGAQATFPPGTCLEQLVSAPGTTPPRSACTAPPGGLVLVLWQTSSAAAPPDRIVIVYADLGSATFSSFAALGSAGSTYPPIAIYMERGGAISVASAGDFASSIKSVGQACSFPVPPFATSATCTRTTFSAAGHISFTSVPLNGVAGAGSHSLGLAPTDVPGFVENFTGLVNPSGH